MQNLWKRVFSWKNHGRKSVFPCDRGCAANLSADVALGEPTKALWPKFLWILGTDPDPTGDSGFCGSQLHQSLEIFSSLCMNCPSQKLPEGIHSQLLALLPHRVLHHQVQRDTELYFIALYFIRICSFLLLVLRCFIYFIQDEGTARSGLETFALH